MTIKINEGSGTQSNIYWNIANLSTIGDGETHDWHMSFKSQLSNTDLFEVPNTEPLTILTNDRYTNCSFSVADLELETRHVNGIYEVELYNETLGLSYKQLVKIITNPGGSTGTKAYISDNEDREAIVYYKPEY